MCDFYILWICCRDCNFFSMCIINLIKCMGRWMTCCDRTFRRRQNETKEGIKRRRKKEDSNSWTMHNVLRIG
jgi:hypothetical protein